MCGIAGAVWFDEKLAVSESTLKAMTDAISHRGPDDEGFYHTHRSGSGVALGHRRLSIIDLGSGHQPLSNEDGTVWIVFNGEIYNYQELRPDLEARGHQFKTHSDTEVIIHLYEEYGPRCLNFLRGMFAFAIWNEKTRELFLARDPLGKKPLHYRFETSSNNQPGRLIFGSELKALLQVPGVPRDVDPVAIDLYLTYQYVPHPHSIFKGYSKLAPGHYTLISPNRFEVQRYWSPPYNEAAQYRSRQPEQWKDELRETLTDAVRLRMRSDVPIGAFLSGGIDSTITSGLMQSLSPHPIHTFSIGFSDKDYDETHFAREAAQRLGTHHHEYEVTPDAISMMPDLMWHYDEPFSDSSAIPTMYLSRVTRQEVTVALSGDGGDELFAGYGRYRAVELAQRIDALPLSIRQGLAKASSFLPLSTKPGTIVRRGRRFLERMAETPLKRYLNWVGIFPDEPRRELYRPEFLAQLNGFESVSFLEDAIKFASTRDYVTQITCVDTLTYLPCDILTKVDIASMSCGLEARCPFLDVKVAELAARMPIELKRQDHLGKSILKQTFSDLLPASIQNRGKMGFGVPIGPWFRGPLQPFLRDVLLSPTAINRGMFREDVIRKMVDEHTASKADHAYRLWNLLMLELWFREFHDRIPLTRQSEPRPTGSASD
jgi:asparagine synthase (glutamine-hydrolysing)